MGGHAAERLVLASISTGAENDLKEATRLASRMVAHFGMSERLGPVYYDHDAEHPFLGMRVATEGGTSPATTNAIEEEARRLLRRALDEAGELLKRQRPALDRLYRALLERESLERDELVAILGASPAPADGDGIAVAAASGADPDATVFPTNGSATSSSSNDEDDVHPS